MGNDPGRFDTVDDPTATEFTKLAGIDFEGRRLSPEEKKKKAMQDSLNWLRNNDPNIDKDPAPGLVSALSKITGLALPKKLTAKKKKKFVEDSISWLRENDPGRLDTVDDPTATEFTKLAGIDVEGRPLSTKEKKKKVMHDTLNWLRNNDPKFDIDPEPAMVGALSKVTGLPMPKKMTAKNKKRFVEDSISWLRENDPGRLDTVDDATATEFTKLAGIDFE